MCGTLTVETSGKSPEKMTEIDKYSKRYASQGLSLAFAMFLIALFIIRIYDMWTLLVPSVVSVLFSVIFDAADSTLWRKVAKKDASYLPTFYTGVSGFRLLAALAVMLIYYIAAGREAMPVFFAVFMAFYLVLLIHHTIFFMRVSNNSSNTFKVNKIQ